MCGCQQSALAAQTLPNAPMELSIGSAVVLAVVFKFVTGSNVEVMFANAGGEFSKIQSEIQIKEVIAVFAVMCRI